MTDQRAAYCRRCHACLFDEANVKRHAEMCPEPPRWEPYARFERRVVLLNLRAELDNVDDALRYLVRRQRELVPSTRTEVCMDVRRRVEDGSEARAACDAELALLEDA